jgi:triosephosphate isomerase
MRETLHKLLSSLKGKSMGVNACRLLLAVVFILSGFVKAVDPLGTQYKIEDYLEAMGLENLLPDFLTLAASVLQSAVEFCLGVFLLFAIRRRLVSRLVLAVLLVMTPLTLWLAITNPISDCGCFGDAIRLTNWQTFWKNVVLLAAAIVVARWPLKMFRFVSESNQWIVINYTAVFIVATSAWCLYDLPVFDFRPYHIGANIKEGMTMPEDAEPPQYETTFILEKDGKQREFTLDEYPDSTWTFVDSRTVMTSEGYVPPIHDFSMSLLSDDEEDEDITDSVLTRNGYTMLLISPHLDQADDSRLDLINELYEYCRQHRYPFYCLTASPRNDISRWRDVTGAEYPFCATDETTLKTIIRSNPGLLLLKDGTIIRKWSHNNLPAIDENMQVKPLEQLPFGQMPADSVPGKILRLLLWFVLPLTLLAIADRMWMWTRWLRRKKHKPQESMEPHQSN